MAAVCSVLCVVWVDEVDVSFLAALVVVVVVVEADCLGVVGLGGSGVLILSSTGGAAELAGEEHFRVIVVILW